MSGIKFILMVFGTLTLLWSSANAEVPAYDRRDEVVGHILLELPHYLSFSESNEKQSLCVVGAASFYSRVSDLNNKKKVFRNIYSSLDETDGKCNYVYAPQTAKARQLLSKGMAQKTILISSYKSFINEGGPIAIVDDDGSIDIYLNLTAVKNQSFYLNPDLIELSKRVIQ